MKPLVRRLGGGWVLALAAGTALLDAIASIIRHVHLESGLDLAIFDQAVWHYSRLEAPFSSIKGFDLLGDHFHPLVAVLAPLYWVWSSPITLLIAQSVLIAASIVPVFLFAESRLGRSGALLLVGAYAVCWPIQVGALFDFHELAFAPLLIALAILLAEYALREPRPAGWLWFWIVIALLLCVKEDLAFFVAFFGLYLLTRGEIAHGVALVVVGIAWYELVTRLAIAHFLPSHTYAYWTYGELGRNPLDAAWALIQAPWRLFTIGFSPAQKAQTIVGLMAPFLFLSLGSRLFILALPLLAERFLSTNHNLWVAHFHYSLPVAPVLAMGAATTAAHLARFGAARWSRLHRLRTLVLAISATMLLTSLLITRAASPDSALSQMTRPSFYKAPSYETGAYQAIQRVARTSSLATIDYVLPHVSERQDLALIDPASVGRVTYILANLTQKVCCAAGNASYAAMQALLAQQLTRMQRVFYESGWVVARRSA